MIGHDIYVVPYLYFIGFIYCRNKKIIIFAYRVLYFINE